MADSAVARLRGILARDMTRTAIDQLLTDAFAETAGVHLIGDNGETCAAGYERLRTALREVRRDLLILYAALPDGLDVYLARIRITRSRIDNALAEQPIPYTLVEPAPRPSWVDSSTYGYVGRLCTSCGTEVRAPDEDQAAQEMEQHVADAHQAGTVTLTRPDGSPVPLTVHVAIDKATLAANMIDPLRRAMKGGR